MTCDTCRHLREVKDLRDRDGSLLTLHYCRHQLLSLPHTGLSGLQEVERKP